MSMQAQLWTVNGLSVELGLDRRTLAVRLFGLAPVGVDGNSKKYLLRDVLEHLQNSAMDEPVTQHRTDFLIDRFTVTLTDAIYRHLAVTLIRSKVRPDLIWKIVRLIEEESDRFLERFFENNYLPEKPSEVYGMIAYGGARAKFLKWLGTEELKSENTDVDTALRDRG